MQGHAHHFDVQQGRFDMQDHRSRPARACVLLALLGAAGVVTHRLGLPLGSPASASLLLTLLGALAARQSLIGIPRRRFGRQILVGGGLSVLLLLLMSSAYAQWVAQPNELSSLRGAVVWSLLGFGDVHAATGQPATPADGTVIDASGHLWIASSALRFAVLWWLVTALGRWRRTARGQSTSIALLAGALLPAGLVLVATSLLVAAWSAGTATPEELTTSPLLYTFAPLTGATAVLLHSSNRKPPSAPLSTRSTGVYVVLAVAVVAPVPHISGAILAAVIATALLTALVVTQSLPTQVESQVMAQHPDDTTVTSTSNDQLGAVAAIGFVAFLLHGVPLAVAQHHGVHDVVALLAATTVSAALAFGTVNLTALATRSVATLDAVLVVVVPAGVLLLLLLFLSTGAFHHEPPRWVPVWERPPE